MREIGSEFWQRYPAACGPKSDNEAHLLSGRTALRFIIDDICRSRRARKALLPAYCCESMILPFTQAGICVDFYGVHREGLDYPYDNDADIVLLIDFFGYAVDQNREIARFEKGKGAAVIYDATHKLNGNQGVEEFADYTFCSWRKWAYCNFATAVKNHGAFTDHPPLRSHEHYLSLRESAAREKERYMAGLHHRKQQFLADFGAAEELLDDDYIGYAGTPVELDLEMILRRRRENAAWLIGELKKIPQIALWREEIGLDDAPMFVPIMIDPKIRGGLRSHLISEQIYCPIHWPKSGCHGVCNELYDMELSLVCDQRYDITDMERMIRVIKNYFNR